MSLATVGSNRQRPPRWWTPQRVWRLAALLEIGATDAAIARELGCRIGGVRWARERYGLQPASRQHFTARQVARMLGFPNNGHRVLRWIAKGWLPARRVNRARHGTWQIRRSDLLAFLENPSYWHRWEPERIRDKSLRAYAERLRGDVRYLTLGEVAYRCCVEAVTAWTWVADGLLPATWDGWRWHVRESDLEGFVPPGQRDRSA